MRTAAALLLVTSGTAFAGKADHALPEVVVKTSFGVFVFRELSVTQAALPLLVPSARAIRISGVIENRTGRTWKYVHFKPRVEDGRGTRITWKYDAFLFPTFAKASSERFAYTLTGRLDAATIGMPGIEFGGGGIPANTSVRL